MKKYLARLVILSLVFGVLFGFASISFAQEYSEAPMLAELVEQGKLPLVEERLPAEPLVVEPVEEVGQHGGDLNEVHTYPGMIQYNIWRTTHEPLIYFDLEGKTIVPNLATKWEVSEEGRVFTFYLRKGVKWSDGVPFTADDIMFWYEDVLLNKELTPAPPSWFSIKGQPGKMKKVDDYTIQIEFPEPFGFFLTLFAGYGDYVCLPKHYLMQFHPKYTSKERLDAMVKEAGFDEWYQLFQNKSDFGAIGRPMLNAWVPATDWSAERWIAVRNPYYWKVDTAGNQLPYIDRFVSTLVQSTDMVIMKALAGEIDFQQEGFMNQFPSYSLLMENREKGNYRILKWLPYSGNSAAIGVNLNCKDPVLKSIFHKREFRAALSLGINRDEINELIYLGLATPSQVPLNPASPFYIESLATKYAKFDPEKANELLDEAGLIERNNDGYRLRPDGKPLQLTMMVRNDLIEVIDVADLIRNYWSKLGIEVAIQPLERSLLTTRLLAGDYELVIGDFGGGMNPLIEGIWFFAAGNWGGSFAPLYGLWYEREGKAGEEPIEEVKRLHSIYDRAIATPNEEERADLIKEAVELHADNVWVIGTVAHTWVMAYARNNLRNVPLKAASEWPEGPGCARFEQFYKE